MPSLHHPRDEQGLVNAFFFPSGGDVMYVNPGTSRALIRAGASEKEGSIKTHPSRRGCCSALKAPLGR